MPVRLDQIPAVALRPARPRVWHWFGLLLLFLLLGLGASFLFGTPQQTVSFWGPALGIPFLSWCVLSFGQAVLYLGQHRAADGWDEAREDDLIQSVRQGRRSQQLLHVSLHSAFRVQGEQPIAQLEALLGKTEALKAQPARLSEGAVRHSQVGGDSNEAPEIVLLQALTDVLADLAQTLALLPDDTPLALMLEVNSALPENTLRRVWRQAWSDSGIRQNSEPVEGTGLAALDQWLDHRINDQALLFVVALQFAPEQPEGTAEVVVGLLLGNRLTQTTLPPMAYLHRPEQERDGSRDGLGYAARQALDWASLDAESIEHVWRVGIDPQRTFAINAVLAELPLPAKPNQRIYNLDFSLGHPGKASPWVAIVAAAQKIQNGAGPQFIFSGDDVAAEIWTTVVTPVSPLSK